MISASRTPSYKCDISHSAEVSMDWTINETIANGKTPEPDMDREDIWCADNFMLTHICFGVNFAFVVIHFVTLICFKKVWNFVLIVVHNNLSSG